MSCWQALAKGVDMFEDRERGYEAKWAHDEEMLFRIMAKRDASLAAWAAGLMHFSAGETADYVQSVINSGLARKKPDPVLAKISADFASHGVACTDVILSDQATSLFEQAKAAMLHERKPS
jgi:hypothetical protein